MVLRYRPVESICKREPEIGCAVMTWFAQSKNRVLEFLDSTCSMMLPCHNAVLDSLPIDHAYYDSERLTPNEPQPS